MTMLTVTARGQVTFRKEVLRHLGIRPGDKIRLGLLPDGRAELKAERPQGSWCDLKSVVKGVAQWTAVPFRAGSSVLLTCFVSSDPVPAAARHIS